MESITQFIGERMADPFGVLVGALWFGLAASLVGAGAPLCLRLWRGERKMLRMPRRWGLGVLVLLIAAGAYVTWHAARAGKPTVMNPTQSGPTPAPVRVARVEKKPFSVFLTALGTVQPTNMVTIRSRVDGHIEKVAFEEGQMVRAGDLLVQLDAAPFRAALEQAIAKRAQDEASLLTSRPRARNRSDETRNRCPAIARPADGAGGATDGPSSSRRRGHRERSRSTQLYDDPLASHRADRIPAYRSWQHRACQRSDRHAYNHAAAADFRDLHVAATELVRRAGGTSDRAAGCDGAQLGGQEAVGARHLVPDRQPGRQRQRHDPAEGELPEPRQCLMARSFGDGPSIGCHLP